MRQEDTFCDSEEAFVHFIDIDSSFKTDIKKKELTFKTKDKNEFKVGFLLISDLVPSKKERYFRTCLKF
ncbi:hypothetical protein, partial [[Flexibacter] sp. ATCC 35208]|uniref:hypothetical protein n=1 Tax=[Flexibacter] sp. ATCC 35208 TaxID=1936242 RepID=UPI001C6FCC42